MPLYRKKGSPFYWIDVRVNGIRHRVSSKQTKPTLARNVESALIHQLSTGQPAVPGQRSPTLGEFSIRFLDFVQGARIDDDTKAYYRNGWRMVSTLPIANMRIRDITTSTAGSINLPNSGATINCALRTLRRMLSLAEEWGVIAHAPKIRMVREAKRERLIRPEEERQVLASANATLRDVFTLVIDTGMRPSEVVALEQDNIDLVGRAVLVAGGKTHNARRRLSIGTRAWEVLVRRSSNGSKWVFPSCRSASHIKAGSVVVMFSKLKRDLGLPNDLVLYSARHTFATDMQSACRDIAKTSRHLGHGSLAITSRYLHPEAADIGMMMDARNAERHKVGHSGLEAEVPN